MASIRNSQGSLVLFDSYDEVDDEAAGITLPGHLEDWLKEVGYQKVVNKTNIGGLYNDIAKRRLIEAINMQNDGYKVFLLILAALLEGDEHDESTQAKKTKKGKSDKSNNSKGGSFPNHWVILEWGSVTLPHQGNFRVYSWGSNQYTIPPAGETWDLDFIAARYYGFIAAKY
ncbi:hypothetical protein [Polyangium fumosum]|uniref:Peptidase C39-like domain-containing protein n=1 Tax=Polyangium fumosum TaxID=889272 RepID=A0A4U1IY83_9BACT|nr:hypothetical protein [Polyangium fumosum]TKC99504.1 hypothetical protein E8A74_37895 [Polyangium fumosum]